MLLCLVTIAKIKHSTQENYDEETAMTPDLVIFDCDGVLVDSEIISNTVLSEVLTSIGLCITPDDCMIFFWGNLGIIVYVS